MVDACDELGTVLSGCNRVTLALWAMGIAEHVAVHVPDSDAVAHSTALCSDVVYGFVEGTMEPQEMRRRISEVRRSADSSEGIERTVLRTIAEAMSVCITRDHASRVSALAVEVAVSSGGSTEAGELAWQLSYMSHV